MHQLQPNTSCTEEPKPHKKLKEKQNLIFFRQVSNAIKGEGCDRHLLGLKLLHSLQEKGPLPEFFQDPIMTRTTYFQFFFFFFSCKLLGCRLVMYQEQIFMEDLETLSLMVMDVAIYLNQILWISLLFPNFHVQPQTQSNLENLLDQAFRSSQSFVLQFNRSQINLTNEVWVLNDELKILTIFIWFSIQSTGTSKKNKAQI